jgi:uncharacterized membrane protein
MKRDSLSRNAAWMGWGAVALLAVLIAVASMRFLAFNAEALDPELRPNLVQHPFLFFAHTTIAPFALLLGVWQFLPVTRRSAYHRWAGRVYVMCVILGSLSGFFIAMTTEEGRLTGTGFMILAVLWFGATLKAYLLARAGDFTAHRVWMIRSYALTCAAITLRIILPTGLVLGAGFSNSYLAAAWGCWIINLVIAEWIIRRGHPLPAGLKLSKNVQQ